MQCLLPQITRICNVFEGVADLGDHLVFRYILPKHFCVDLVNKLLHYYIREEINNIRNCAMFQAKILTTDWKHFHAFMI